MAVFSCNFHSDILGYEADAKVVLPEYIDLSASERNRSHKYQVLYLLHGRGDSAGSWSRFVPIERYAREHKLAVVMPGAEESFYTNSIGGKRFFDFIAEELPEKIRHWFPISSKKEDTFIAGLSMGGYGAMKAAFTYPENYQTVGVFSAVTDIEGFEKSVPEVLKTEMRDNLLRVFGSCQEIRPQDDLLFLYRQGKKQGKKMPPLIQYIGTEDFLYEINQSFFQELKKEGAQICYEEWTGSHQWEFWDTAIQKCLRAMPLKNTVVYEEE